jgi:tetratricopeptide (TPR) repeat protein
MGVVSFDYDDDGDVDLYTANDSMPNSLYRNRGDGTFEEVGALSGAAYNADGATQGSMGIDVGDFDGDGRFDLVVTNFAHDYYALYRNLGGAFADDSFATGVAVPTFAPLGWGVHFLDVDHDSDLDLFFSNGHIYPQVDSDPVLHETFLQKNLLLLNHGGKFEDVTASAGSGFETPRSGRGSAAGDLDSDLDLDIVVSNQDQSPTLLVNETEGGGHAVLVALVDSRGTRQALGARLEATAGGKTQIRQIASGGSYASQNDFRAHFGLGDSEMVERLTITWLDGEKEVHQGVPQAVVRRASGAPPSLFFSLMTSFLLWLVFLAQDPRELGREALAEGRLDEAETHFQAALASNPPRVFEVHYALGRLYLQKRDYPRARESFDACLSRAPRFAPALVGRARASLFLEDMEAAVADLTAARSLPDAPAESQLLESDIDLYLSRGAGASPGPIQDPQRERVSAGRRGPSVRGKNRRRVALFSRRLGHRRSEPDRVPVLERARRRSAAALSDASFRVSPRARCFREERFRGCRGRSRENPRAPSRVRARAATPPGIARGGEAVGRCPRSVREAGLGASARLRASRPRQPARAPAEAHGLAECHALRALELKPQEPTMLFLLAESQLGAGDAAEAIATCERAIASGAATAPVYFTLGNALHGRMEIAASIAALRRAVELDPQAAEDIASFALSSLTTEDFRSLRSLLEAHVEEHPRNLNTLYSLGVMSLREGELEKARKYLERVREIAPRDVQAHYNLALLHQRAGREDLARESMARFQELKAEEDALAGGSLQPAHSSRERRTEERIDPDRLVKSPTEGFRRLRSPGRSALAARRLGGADAFERRGPRRREMPRPRG